MMMMQKKKTNSTNEKHDTYEEEKDGEADEAGM